MSEPTVCKTCGAQLPKKALGGLCHRCVAKRIIEEEPEEPSPPPQAKPSPAPSSEAKAGDVLGNCKLLERIGEGGFGEVWMAAQTAPVKRRVALKILKPGMDSRRVVARFEAERQTLALMNHPNIAKVLDAGMTPAGRPYFVMELARGARITDYCDQNKLDTAARLRLFILVCQAIQHAHQKGVIHRDIKPSNIIVTLQEDAPTPKVIDFGIAKATGGAMTEMTVFTEFHQFIGTPAYTSPEQVTGADVDTRSDIYSLGVLLYELLVGQTPFDAKGLMKGGIDVFRQAIRDTEPAKPSTKLKTLTADQQTATAARRQTEPPKLAHLLRGDLDWIVMKCLEKDRARRYETANGLAADIQRHLANEPVVARPPSTAYWLGKLIRRNRLRFAAAALMILMLLVGTGVSSWQAVRATRAERLANGRLLEVGAERDARKQAQTELEARNLELRHTAYRSFLYSAAGALERGEHDRARGDLEQCEPALRGWEWAHLDLKLPLARRIPEQGKAESAMATLLTRDSSRLLCIGYHEPQLKIWDARTGAELGHFTLPDLPNAFDLSPDERTVAIGGTNGVLRLHDLTTGAVRWEAHAHGGWIYGVAFSPDGSRIAAAGADRAVTLWNLSGQRLGLKQTDGGNRGLSFSPDGRTLLAGSMKGNARLLAADTLEDIATLDAAQCVAFPADGRRFVTGGADGFVRVWDAARREVLVTCAPPHTKTFGKEYGALMVSNVSAVAFSPNGRWIASSGLDQAVRLWEAASGRLRAEFPALVKPTGWLPSLQFSSDGRLLMAGGGNGVAAARLWNLQTELHETLLGGHSNRIWSAAFTPDSRYVLTAGFDRQMVLSRAEDGRFVRALRGHQRSVWSVAITPDGRRAVSGSEDGTVRVWELETGQTLRVIPVQLSRTNQWNLTLFVALSPDGRHVASGGYDGRVQVWDTDTGVRLWEAASRHDAIWSIAWSADGRRIAAGGANTRLTLLDAVGGVELWHTNQGPLHTVSVVFGPDGQRLLTGDYAGAISLWETETGRFERKVGTHLGILRSVAFSPDGRRIASAGDDPNTLVWDTRPGPPLLSLPEPMGINFITFSPDGRCLLGARDDGKARIWQTEPRRAGSP